MILRNAVSLRWRITLALLLFQLLVLSISSILTIVLAFQSAPLGVIASPYLTGAVSKSIGRDKTGKLTIYPDEQLESLLLSSPGIWAIAQSDAGERVTIGNVPDAMYSLADISDRIEAVTIQGKADASEVTALFGRAATPYGDFSILSGGGGFLSFFHAVLILGHLVVLAPGITLLVLTLVGVPLFINRCLRSVRQLTGEIDRIDFAGRRVRLETDRLPQEMRPIMAGVNAALQRMDAGFEMTERFFMNAAQELRTHVAILQVRLDGLSASPEREKLREVVRRLSVVINQLLDVERYRQNSIQFDLVDFSSIVSATVTDMAPYAVAKGYSIELNAPQSPVWVEGDAQALNRVTINLIQNAIQHGGGRGCITVTIQAEGSLEVSDQGPGIPWDRRERIFEPFYRINPRGTDAGLGLKLVRDIVRLHRGEVTVTENMPWGSKFIVKIPILRKREVHDGIREGRFMSVASPDLPSVAASE